SFNENKNIGRIWLNLINISPRNPDKALFEIVIVTNQGTQQRKKERYSKKEEKMGTRERERDRELLIPVSTISENGVAKSSTPTATPATPSSHGH
ncbi:hypothetical protein Gogos_017979, partial [Gossypium gossypioides]|nr:hypothetical protein [Gossypium gossypioides]